MLLFHFTDGEHQVLREARPKVTHFEAEVGLNTALQCVTQGTGNQAGIPGAITSGRAHDIVYEVHNLCNCMQAAEPELLSSVPRMLTRWAWDPHEGMWRREDLRVTR